MLEYYTSLKKGFILQSKGAHLEKIFAAALRARGEIISSALHGTAWPLHFKFASYAYDIPFTQQPRD